MEARLLRWFAGTARDLPWRKTSGTYAILVSEVMAQQYGVEDDTAVRTASTPAR